MDAMLRLYGGHMVDIEVTQAVHRLPLVATDCALIPEILLRINNQDATAGTSMVGSVTYAKRNDAIAGSSKRPGGFPLRVRELSSSFI